MKNPDSGSHSGLGLGAAALAVAMQLGGCGGAPAYENDKAYSANPVPLKLCFNKEQGVKATGPNNFDFALRSVKDLLAQCGVQVGVQAATAGEFCQDGVNVSFTDQSLESDEPLYGHDGQYRMVNLPRMNMYGKGASPHTFPHQIGHSFGLSDQAEQGNLMSAVPSGVDLTVAQCDQIRERALYLAKGEGYVVRQPMLDTIFGN